MDPKLLALESRLAAELSKRKAAKTPGSWCPHAPTPKQQEFLGLTCLEALYGGAAGGGKALSLSTPIPTPSGWTTMADIQPGDMVFGLHGQPTRVVAVSEVMLGRPCIEIGTSDGAAIVCDEAHLWPTLNLRERTKATRRTDEYRASRRASRARRGSGKRPDLAAKNAAMAAAIVPMRPPVHANRTAGEVLDTLLYQGRTNHSLPLVSPMRGPDASLPIDPYVLGVWLGDGTSAGGGITTADQEVVDSLVAAGIEVRKRSAKYNWGTVGLSRELRLLGLLGNKHVPPVYLRASFQQRLALLQGLMDTDGHACDSGACEFTTTSPRLRDGMLELLRSLGVPARVSEGIATLYGRAISPKYRIKWTSELPAFRLARKRDRQKSSGLRKTRGVRYITSARRVESVPVKCIQVESEDGIYLAGEHWVPTHNSDALLMDALQYVHVPGYSALVLRRTYADLALPGAIMDRARDWLIPKGVDWNDKDKRFTFPSGATLSFGYLDSDRDRFRYQGAELQYIAFDELTQFPEQWYRYLLSRLRRVKGLDVPIRARAASNPGGIGHDWVKRRFVDDATGERVFVPAKLDDNPHLDRDEYAKSLAQLDATTRRQLLEGIWVRDSGGLVYQFDETRNVIHEAPKLAHHIVGIDYGVTDATAWTVVGWRENDPTVYVVESYKREGLTPSDAAIETRALAETYNPVQIVGDVGGLGKAFAEEARRRFSLPIEPAEKQNKRGYQALFNGDLESGRIRVVRSKCEQLVKEWCELPWTEDRTKEAEGFDNHCCLVAGTMVETETGPVPIEDVRPGMKVQTRRGLRLVIDAWCTGVRPTWLGMGITGTGDHPVWTIENGWVPLAKLASMHTVMAWANTGHQSESSSTGFGTVGIQNRLAETFGCTSSLREDADCTETSGSTITGRYPTATTCTTSTEILSTTRSATSNACQAESTCGCTLATQTACGCLGTTSRSPESLQDIGTGPAKDGRGTQCMLARCGQTESRWNACASGAAERFRQRPGRPTCVPTHATLPCAGTQASTTRPGNADSVGTPFGPTSTQASGFALVRAAPATPTGRDEPVYNLTVDDAHEYVANGILVSNCDSSLYSWRACVAYPEREEEPLKPHGTREWAIAEGERLERLAAERLEEEARDRELNRAWWEQ